MISMSDEREVETVADFCDRKIRSGMDMLEDWVVLHPQATTEEAFEELFQILMGKRVQ